MTGKKSYRLGINQFTDLTEEDWTLCEIDGEIVGEFVKDRDLLC
jgi:hypothetical protein